MKTLNRNSEKGSLMLVVLAFILIFSSIMGAWLAAAITNSIQTERKLSHGAAFYLAEAANEQVKEWVTSRVELHTHLQGSYNSATIFSGEQMANLGAYQWITEMVGNSGPWVEMPGAENRYYTAKLEATSRGFYPPMYTIVSWGLVNPDGVFGATKDDELVRKIIVKSTLGSFARYAYFTEREDNIWFITNDVLLGLVHTNALHPDSTPSNPIHNYYYSLHFAGKPDFWGEVTTCADSWYLYSVGRTTSPSSPPDEPNFRDGYEMDAVHVPYPKDATQIQEASQGPSGIVIQGDTTITLSVEVGDIGMITYIEEEEQVIPAWDEDVWVEDGHWEYEPCGSCWRCRRGQSYRCRNKRRVWVSDGGHWETVHHPEETQTVVVTKTEEVYSQDSNPDGKAVVYVDGDAEVSGELAGQLTILTEGDIWIVDDVTYNTNPVDFDGDGLISDANNNGINDPPADRTGDGDTDDPGEQGDDLDDDGDGDDDTVAYGQPSSTDTLGLVSKGDVIVADDDTSEHINREIDAAIMALGIAPNRTGKFYVEDYNQHREDTLTIVGSLVQVKRGAVGTFNGSIYGDITINSGFAKNYIYDWRLLYYPPPYFLPTNLIDMIYWQELPYWSSD